MIPSVRSRESRLMRTNLATARTSTPAAGLSPTDAAEDIQTAVYQRVHSTPEFQRVRRQYRNFAFPAVIGVMVWYMLYAVLCVTAPGFMSAQLFGQVNVAFAFTVLQVLTTMIVSALYGWNAKTKRDDAALRLRWQAQEELR
jgi:uncharacterized membrane protein (DUF485 family)